MFATAHTELGQSSKKIVAPRKNAPENRADIGWKYGVDVQGNARKVKCNYCAKTISGGIFRFKYHLAGTREDSEPCPTILEEVKVKVVMEAKVASHQKRNIDVEADNEDSEHHKKKRKRCFQFRYKI